MEKSKNNVPIDPLLAQKYFADAASKARGIIEWPAHEITVRPAHEIVPIVNPDREAERNSAEAHQDYQTMRGFYPDDISAMRNIKEVKSRAKYAESIGKNPDTYIGIRTPGTTENFVGDSRNSVLRTIDVQLIKNSEQEAIESGDQANQEFIKKLDNYITHEEKERRRPFKRSDYPSGLFGDNSSVKPYDKDKEESSTAA